MSKRPTRKIAAYALLAALFAIITIAHTGAHLDRAARGGSLGVATDGELGCGLCQNAATSAPATVTLAPAGALVTAVTVLHSSFVCAPESGALSSRGPPAA